MTLSMAMVVNNASFLWKRFYVKLQFYRCGRLVEPYVGIILDYTIELCQYPKLNILNCSTTLLYLYFVQLLITFLSIKTVRQNCPKLYYYYTLYLELLLSHVSLYSIYYLLPSQNHKTSRSILALSRVRSLFSLSHAS